MQNILYHLWGECRFFFNSHEFSHERRRLSNYEDKANQSSTWEISGPIDFGPDLSALHIFQGKYKICFQSDVRTPSLGMSPNSSFFLHTVSTILSTGFLAFKQIKLYVSSTILQNFIFLHISFLVSNLSFPWILSWYQEEIFCTRKMMSVGLCNFDPPLFLSVNILLVFSYPIWHNHSPEGMTSDLLSDLHKAFYFLVCLHSILAFCSTYH